jgi:hypothetical protein
LDRVEILHALFQLSEKLPAEGVEKYMLLFGHVNGDAILNAFLNAFVAEYKTMGLAGEPQNGGLLSTCTMDAHRLELLAQEQRLGK